MQDFNDHCWKDLLDDEILEIYSAYHREVFVGPSPAVLAIDLYASAYRGGNIPVREANRVHPGSCGENAWKAIEPTQRLFKAARAAGISVIYTTRHADTGGVKSTKRNIPPRPKINMRSSMNWRRSRANSSSIRNALPPFSARPWSRICAGCELKPDCLRRKYIRLRARLNRGRIFQRLPQHRR